MIDQALAYVRIISGAKKKLRLGLSQDIRIGKSRTEEGGSEVDVDVDSDRVFDKRFPLCGRVDESLLGGRVCVELGVARRIIVNPVADSGAFVSGALVLRWLI